MKECFIFWDSNNFKLFNPESNYSIENLPGSPYKITWDNSEHIINNPNNYSYSIEGINYAIINYYWTSGARWLSSKLPLWEDELGSCYIVTTSGRKNVHTSRGLYGVLTNFSQTVINESFTYNSGNATVWERTVGTKPPSVQTLRIIDNNIIYSYSINDRNSINIIASSDEKNIIIENNSFNLIDENSVYKKCNDECPQGTIPCDCSNIRCCYEKVSYGYKLVKSIETK